MHRVSCARILLLALFSSIGSYAQIPPTTGTDKVYIGFLDDAREEMVNWKPGVAKGRIIRLAFEKTASGWKVADSLHPPARMEWTIAFDGRSLGRVESQQDPKQGLTPVQTILTRVAEIPTIGAPSQEFAGLMADGPGRVRRPLVAVSKPYFRDPDAWKRSTKLPIEIAALVRKSFRHDYPRVSRCKDEEVVEKDWKFPDSALELPVAYASNKRSFLVKAQLAAGECGYVDNPDDPLSDPWFFVSADGTVRRIGSFMSLLDAGDYDNDGRSELIFFLTQPEDTDGFLLFDSSLQKQASFIWSYH